MPKKSTRGSKPLHGWRQKQSRTKLNNKVKLGFIILTFLALILISGWVIRIFNTVFINSWKLSSDHTKSLNFKFNTNFILSSDSISLVSFNTKEKKVTQIRIPPETYLQAGQFGRWQIRSLYSLGESTQIGFGPLLMSGSISTLFGVPIDGFIHWNDESSKKDPDQILFEMRQKIFGCLGLFAHIETNFTPWELNRLCWEISGVRFDKVVSIDLSDFNLLDQAKLADGSGIFTIDPIKLDSVIDQFVDPTLRGDNISVAIFNATQYPSLAQHARRMITNLGGNVIFIGNFNKELKTSLVMGNNSETYKYLKQIFVLCEKTKDCDKIEPEELEALFSRAEINIFLGEDYYQKIRIQPKN